LLKNLNFVKQEEEIAKPTSAFLPGKFQRERNLASAVHRVAKESDPT